MVSPICPQDLYGHQVRLAQRDWQHHALRAIVYASGFKRKSPGIDRCRVHRPCVWIATGAPAPEKPQRPQTISQDTERALGTQYSAEGLLTALLTQLNPSLTRRVAILDTACLAGGAVSGSVNGDAVIFGAVYADTVQTDFAGTVGEWPSSTMTRSSDQSPSVRWPRGSGSLRRDCRALPWIGVGQRWQRQGAVPTAAETRPEAASSRTLEVPNVACVFPHRPIA